MAGKNNVILESKEKSHGTINQSLHINSENNQQQYNSHNARFEDSKLIDVQRTDELKDSLNQYGIFESEEKSNFRLEICNKIKDLVKQWIIEVSKKMNIPSGGERIYTFGSYKLGVHTKHSDIDILCIATVARSRFFGDFVELLKQQSEVKNLRAIETTFVPVIKMNFDGIDVDIVYTRIDLEKLPEQLNLKDKKSLSSLDIKCLLSLCGYLNTEEILNLVQSVNRENFEILLNTIKFWAKRYGIYSSATGFLGGISWTVLCLYVCQRYCHETAARLINNFFRIFSQWSWSEPILLKPTEKCELEYPFWDPTCSSSNRYIMIATPAFPELNASSSVNKSTRTVINEYFKLGLKITNEIMQGKANWSKLFEPPNFFEKYQHFIVLTVSASNEMHHFQWNSYVQSRLRFLVENLERHDNIELPHVNSQSFFRIDDESNEFQSLWFIGLKFKSDYSNLRKYIKKFKNIVTDQAINREIYKDEMNIIGEQVMQKELRNYLSDDVLNIGLHETKHV